MKKLFIIALIMYMSATGVVLAKSDKFVMPSVKFNGTIYSLVYSAKSSETGGYINEYYKANQTYASWTELIGVHHYPTAYYPIEHAKAFAEYLQSGGVVVGAETDEENNTALLYFVVADKSKLPIIIEFNVFKYIKSPVCGTVGFQYARRYRLNSPLEIEKTQKIIAKTGLKYIKKVNKFEVPDVITIDADNGKFSLKEGCNNSIENLD